MRATGRWGFLVFLLFIVVNTNDKIYLIWAASDNNGPDGVCLVLFIVVITIKYTYHSLIDMGGLRLQRAIETDIQ